MMRRCISAFVLAFLLSCYLHAAPAPVDQLSAQQALPMQVEQHVLAEDHVQLGLRLVNDGWYSAGSLGEEVEMIAFPLAGATSEIGKPAVPVMGRMFRVPPRAGIVMEVLSAEYETYTDVEYATFMGYELDEPFAPCDNPVDEWYPGTIAQVGDPAVFHDFRVSNLVTYPVQVNTARREVRVYSNIEVDIRYEGVDDRNTIPNWPTEISEAFLPAYRLLMDWDDDELDEYILYRGHVQVVMRDDDVLWAALGDWLEWKRQRGWVLDFLTDEDVPSWTSYNIDNELEDRYETASPKFDYVAIIGDESGSFSVPPGVGGYGGGDQIYSELAGDDILADVGVGRISVENVQQLNNYVAKIFNYERTPYMEDTAWYLRGMVNRSDGCSGVSKIMSLRYYRHALFDLGYTQVDTSFGIGNSIAITRINNGVSFYGARGVQGTGLQIGNINSLSNDYMTPVVIDVTCGTGNWCNETSISEAYMRAGTAAVPTGGICGMSMATSATQPDFNNCLTGGSGWAMLQLGMPALGDMILMGKVNGFNNYYGNNTSQLEDFMQWYNLMGDPTVYTWVGIPQELTVDVVEELELGENHISVEVVDESGPVADALVTFYKYSNGEEIQVINLTDEEGCVTLDAPVRESGEAMLTVIKRHYAPVQVEIDVNDPTARVGWVEVSYVDNGVGGTDGDGDGVPEAGETVGLEMTLKNYGTSAAASIEVTAEESEEWITDLSGSIVLGSLNPDAQSQGNGMIIVEIDPEAQQDFILHLDLTVSTSQGDYTDGYSIVVQAPSYAFVNMDMTGAFNPGNTREVEIEIRNIGGGDAAASEAWLFSNDPFVRIEQGGDDLAAMGVDQTATGTFSIRAHEDAIPGYVGWFYMQVTTSEGQVDTVGIPVQIGTKSSTDPNGPDNYGYFAFDNTDTGYQNFVPSYNWIEINPEAQNTDYQGESLDLTDTAENYDVGVTIDLPFDVQYYGEVFEEISVSTNGYASFGRNADVSLARNWTIPSPLGPNDMLAVYWDELRTAAGSDILYYYDEDNGRFIIEWYDMRHHYSQYSCTFEVIIYDQDVVPTWSGDNDILFQYHDVQHSTGGMQYDVPFWTTGIENHTQDDGILISYWNQYTAGSATIEDERAILFTTNIPLIVGYIEGTITAADLETPIENAWIGTPNHLFETVTDADGHFFIDNVMTGPVSFDIEADCFNSRYNLVLTVTENETLHVDFQLNHPEFMVTPLAVGDTLEENQESTHSVWVHNPGNGVMNWEAHFDFEPDAEVAGNPGKGAGQEKSALDELDEPWDQVYHFDLDDSEALYRGIEFDGVFFWLTGSNNYDVTGPNLLYKYTRDGDYVATYDQPVPAADRSSQGMFGLEWDGEYMYGADNGILYQMQFNTQANEWEVVSSFEIPANPSRYIVKNPETGEFFIGDYGIEIRVVHPDSTGTLRQIGQDYAPRGAAWYPEDPDGYNLYFIAMNNGDDYGHIIKMHPQTGDTMNVAQFEYDGGIPSGACMSYLWNPQIWMFASMMDAGQQDYVQLWEVDQFDAWIHIMTTEGTLAPGDSQEVELQLTPQSLPPDVYDIYIRFDHDACIAEDNFVHVVLEVLGGDVKEDPASEAQPVEWVFEGAYPNPFNPSTTVSYSLKRATDVRLSVYNLLGQEVARLVDQPMQAGQHRLIFDGSNLASGIYFLHLNAGPLQETRKIILMK